MSKKNKIFLGLMLLVSFGLCILYTHQLGFYTWDEFFSVTFSQKNLLHSIKYWLMETNPPLHMILLKIWFLVFPIAPFFARLPSIVCGLLSVWFFFHFALKHFNEKIAWLGTIILVFNTQTISADSLARGYGLLLLLSILSISFFYEQYIDHKNIRGWILPLINGLALFTHLTAVALIISQIIYLLIFDKLLIKKYFKQHIYTGLFIFIWYVVSIFFKPSMPKYGAAWFFNILTNPITFFSTINAGFNPTDNLYISILIPIIAVAGAIYLLQKLWCANKQLEFKKFIFPLIFWLLMVIFMLCTGMYSTKFYFIAALAFLLMISFAISTLPLNTYITSALFILLFLPKIIFSPIALPARNWDALTGNLDDYYQKDKKQALLLADFTDLLWINEFVKNGIPILTVNKNTDDKDEINKKLITENYIFYNHPDVEIDNWIKNNNIPQNYSEVFVLQNEVDSVDLISGLKRFGYVQKNQWGIDSGKSQTNFYLYAKY